MCLVVVRASYVYEWRVKSGEEERRRGGEHRGEESGEKRVE